MDKKVNDCEIEFHDSTKVKPKALGYKLIRPLIGGREIC